MASNKLNFHQQQIAKADAILESLPSDDPRALEAMKARAEAKRSLADDKMRAQYADLSAEELAAKVEELNADDGPVAIARAEWRDAEKKYPSQPSLETGRSSEVDPRALKAKRAYEAARKEAFSLSAELQARNAEESRVQFYEGRIASELQNRGIADDQRLQALHDKQISLGLYEEAESTRAKIDTPYEKRAFAQEAAKHAYDEAKAQLDAAPSIRTIGNIIQDKEVTNEFWAATRTVVDER